MLSKHKDVVLCLFGGLAEHPAGPSDARLALFIDESLKETSSSSMKADATWWKKQNNNNSQDKTNTEIYLQL